jgi:hypothetical protein
MALTAKPYEVLVACDACPGHHPIGIRVALELPDDQHSAVDVETDSGRLPADFDFRLNFTRCPATGRPLLEREHDQIFLVRRPKPPMQVIEVDAGFVPVGRN